MFNIFQQPWTMLGVAIISMVIIFVVRCVWPNKQHWWQLLIPPLIALLGFGIDYFVKTDLEKIDSLIKTGISVVETKNPRQIETILSDSYRDSASRTKAEMVAYCDAVLSQNIVKNCHELSSRIDIASKTNATVLLSVMLAFDKTAEPELQAVPFLKVKVKLDLQKQADKNWRVSRSELLELNDQPVNWQNIR